MSTALMSLAYLSWSDYVILGKLKYVLVPTSCAFGQTEVRL